MPNSHSCCVSPPAAMPTRSCASTTRRSAWSMAMRGSGTTTRPPWTRRSAASTRGRGDRLPATRGRVSRRGPGCCATTATADVQQSVQELVDEECRVTLPVVVVGAGLAGLTCAGRLSRRGIDVVVLEAGDAVGGRVRTDRVDGFVIDRGFQVLNTAYPALRATVDLDRVDLRSLPRGARIRRNGRLADVRHPLSSAGAVLQTASSRAASGREKAAI